MNNQYSFVIVSQQPGFSSRAFATASLDKSLKLWDARNLNGPIEEYKLRNPANNMSISHQGVLALGMGNMIEIYNNKIIDSTIEKKVYLRHKIPKIISNLEFCPFEDVLGVAHATGFASLLIPGSGEPNFDAMEANPFQSKSQRKEAEVHALLGKVRNSFNTFYKSHCYF